MEDLKLLDILQTLCIGIFSIVSIIFFYFFYNRCFAKEKINESKFFTWLKDDILKGKMLETGYLSLAFFLIYFLGIIASDLTERMTDSNNNKERSIVLKELNYISGMPSVGDIRKLTLIDSEDTLTTLGNSVFSSYPLIKEANKFNKTNYFLNSSGDSLLTSNTDSLAKNYLKDEKFERFISLLYYTSKNWCYSKQHEPLNELKSIQTRIDLSRSIVLLSTVAIQLIIFFYILFIAINFNKVFNKNDVLKFEFNIQFKSVSSAFLKSLILFAIVAILCRECFKICLLSYDKRAYGYYVSNLAKTEIEKNENK